MTPTRAMALALLVLATAVEAAPARAQVTVAPPPTRPVVEGLLTEGRVTRVDPATRRITLDNGEDYVIPPSLEAAWKMVADGSAVRVRYNVDGGRNIVSRLELVQ